MRAAVFRWVFDEEPRLPTHADIHRLLERPHARHQRRIGLHGDREADHVAGSGHRGTRLDARDHLDHSLTQVVDGIAPHPPRPLIGRCRVAAASGSAGSVCQPPAPAQLPIAEPPASRT
jgi:hypothetical protein